MTKLYLAGPMSGLPDFNYHAFHSAATQLREAGHTVFNPADNDVANGFDPRGTSGDPAEAKEQGFNLRTALKQDLSWICDHAEGIALLPGWEESKGARTEVSLGHALGIESWLHSYWLIELEKIAPVETVSFKLGQGIVIEPVLS